MPPFLNNVIAWANEGYLLHSSLPSTRARKYVKYKIKKFFPIFLFSENLSLLFYKLEAPTYVNLPNFSALCSAPPVLMGVNMKQYLS